jgi:hypothetical protein
MGLATSLDAVNASHASLAARRFWLERVGHGLLVGFAIVVLEFAYYYPLVSTPDSLAVASLVSLFLTWCGESVLLMLIVGLFERWAQPRLLGSWQLVFAVAVGSIAGVLAWQALVQLVLRNRFGVMVFSDHVGQPVSFSGIVLYHVWLILVFGGLATALHVSRARHAGMLAVLRAAELGREDSQARLAEARLAGLQRRIEPEFLLQILTRLEHLYEANPAGADRLLDELIVFLRAALADIRSSDPSMTAQQTRPRDEAFQMD